MSKWLVRWSYYRFHKFTKDGCKVDWTVIASLVPSTLFMCVTKAFFQLWGKAPELKDFLNIIDNGIAMNSLTDFIISMGQPSGPRDLLLGKFMILLCIESGMRDVPVESDVGREEVSSQVKIWRNSY